MSMSLPAAPLLYEQGPQALIALQQKYKSGEIAFPGNGVFKTFAPKSFEIIRTVSLTVTSLLLNLCTRPLVGVRGQKIIAGMTLLLSSARVYQIFKQYSSQDPLMSTLLELGGEKTKFEELPQFLPDHIQQLHQKGSLVDLIQAIDPHYLTHPITVTKTPKGRRVFIIKARVAVNQAEPHRKASEEMVVAFVENFNYWDLPFTKRPVLESLKHIFGFKSIDTRCYFTYSGHLQDQGIRYRTFDHSEGFAGVHGFVLQTNPALYEHTHVITGSLSSDTANLLAAEYKKYLDSRVARPL